MVSSTQQFMGLGMPVFTAFGWAGEETAINYALSQLELFVQTLHRQLSRDLQTRFPLYGVDRESQGVYLAAKEEVESDIHVDFYARPMTLQMVLTVSEKSVLKKIFKTVNKNLDLYADAVIKLGDGWDFRIQQMEYDEETGARTHYKDLIKKSVTELNQQQFKELASTGEYLNSEDKWVAPIFISWTIAAEQASIMGLGLISEVIGKLSSLDPVLALMVGKTRRRRKPPAERPPSLPVQEIPEPVIDIDGSLDHFFFVTEIKALHLRRGFINLTPAHWPFFASNARTETREAVIEFNDRSETCSVWRLVPNDQARIVLGRESHEWLEDTFEPNDAIQVIAVKMKDQEIKLTLRPVNN